MKRAEHRSIRLTPELEKGIERVTPIIARRNPEVRVTRSFILRAIIARGIEAVEEGRKKTV